MSRWRLYARGKSSYQTIEAAQCIVQDDYYVFLDAEGKELARFPVKEHGGLVSVGFMGDK